MRQRAAAVCACLGAAMAAAATPVAEPSLPAAWLDALAIGSHESVWRDPLAALARGTGSPAPAGRSGSSTRGGFLLGVDVGMALRFPSQGDPLASALSFSARAGYAFANGASVDLGYDNLGLPIDTGAAGNLQAFSLGARFEPIFLPVIPFAEVRLGPAFQGGSTWPAGALGAGLAVPLARQLRVQLSAREWLVPINQSVRSLLALSLGLEIRL